MKKIILLFVPIIFFGCKTFKNPRYNIKSYPVYCELESEHENDVLTSYELNNSSDLDGPAQEDLNFTQDNVYDQAVSGESFNSPREESSDVLKPETGNPFFSTKTHILNKQKIIQYKQNTKSRAQSFKKSNNSSSGSARPALIFAGILLTLASILILWFVSILGGILILLGGLGLWIGALTMPKPETTVRPSSNRNQTEVPYNQMVDVVYLKNGGVRRGIIIEQIPGESLKIKTNDGSVYVFKMDEIAKITKE